jgi:hypothetical protein
MKNTQERRDKTAFKLIQSKDFQETPSWAVYFSYLESREEVCQFYSDLVEKGFCPLDTPHETGRSIFVAQLMSPQGKEVILRSN